MSVFATAPRQLLSSTKSFIGGYRRPFARVELSQLEADYLILSSGGDKNTWRYNFMM